MARFRSLSAVLILLAAIAGGSGVANAAKAPKRVVALTPFTANTLSAIGVKPIAVGAGGGSERFTASLNGVRRLRLAHPNGPNMEQLAALKPDLVLSNRTWRKGHAIIRRLKIKVLQSDPGSVAQVATETRRIGRMLGSRPEAVKLARRQAQAIVGARRRARSRPSVLMILGVGRTSFAFLENSWGGDIATAAGARLITAGLKSGGGFARISDEAVVARDPEIIIAVPHGNPEDIDRVAEHLRTNPAWRSTRAARNKRVYVVADDSLLQPYPDVATTIRKLQTRYLKND